MNKDFIIPCHVGIIMDGNGRWATKRGLSRSVGHKAGADNIKKLCLHAADVGVKYLSLYAFSTENFKRSAEEVNFLMDLFIRVFTTEFKVFEENNVKVLFSGRREPLSKKVLETMDGIVERTKNNTALVLNICLNYGGQSEIADTTKKICQMYKDGLIKPSLKDKSASLVGLVMKKYHPHGDSSIYDTIVTLVDWFKTKYPLFYGKGNWGNVGGAGAAAQRYTECALSNFGYDSKTH